MTLPTGNKPTSDHAERAHEAQRGNAGFPTGVLARPRADRNVGGTAAGMLPGGKRRQERRRDGTGGFTLIELILVMTMLLIVLSVSAPSLSRFFRGRTLDLEVNRFVALTRYGQSRAVSEGVPVILWIDPQKGEYGLEADSSYTDQDTKTLEYQVDKGLQVQVEQSMLALKLGAVWKGNSGLAMTLPKIRFSPDGFISESSPELIVFRQGDGEVWVGPSRNRLHYEIQTNDVQQARR